MVNNMKVSSFLKSMDGPCKLYCVVLLHLLFSCFFFQTQFGYLFNLWPVIIDFGHRVFLFGWTSGFH